MDRWEERADRVDARMDRMEARIDRQLQAFINSLRKGKNGRG
jgi:hypothetical protein